MILILKILSVLAILIVVANALYFNMAKTPTRKPKTWEEEHKDWKYSDLTD